jgi:hypothetical protein
VVGPQKKMMLHTSEIKPRTEAEELKKYWDNNNKK